ncbi:hypothetical protein AcW1_004961 [Taiwanofungus camphoratus]|nr:hypothetical protein AcV5_001345 [Antrodia cinnamomea]KAI0960454.1 hypothetical protein AcW1_004961 [Antrodia cinnamomea]
MIAEVDMKKSTCVEIEDGTAFVARHWLRYVPMIMSNRSGDARATRMGPIEHATEEFISQCVAQS